MSPRVADPAEVSPNALGNSFAVGDNSSERSEVTETKRRPPKAALGKKNTRRLRRARRGTTAAIPDRRVFDPPKNLRVAVDVISDPYGISISAQKEKKRRRDGSTSPGEGEWVSQGQPQITVLRSIRTDPLGWQRSHGQIDEAEYLAGRQWQALYERSQVGSVQAVDTSKEPVDGGKFSELMTDGQRMAIKKIRDATLAVLMSCHGDRARGQARAALLQDVLAAGMFIKAAAFKRGISAERAISTLAKEFHATLSTLADHFGYAGSNNNNKKSKVRGWRQDGQKEDRQKAG